MRMGRGALVAAFLILHAEFCFYGNAAEKLFKIVFSNANVYTGK